MAGYSGTPLHKKLGVKAEMAVRFVNQPKEFAALAAEFPTSEKLDKNRGVNLTLGFYRSVASLNKSLAALKGEMAQDGMIWIAWPKKASGVETDLDENIVREIGLKIGLVDVKVCAIDETWSGLKFVIPLKARAKAGSRP